MTTATDADSCARFVREQRVHFETLREHVDDASHPAAAGFLLRIFALHDKGAHEVPNCPACHRLALELRRVAEAVLADGSLDADAEVAPLSLVLYDSRRLPEDTTAPPLLLGALAGMGTALV
jgi:hypothetical protein